MSLEIKNIVNNDFLKKTFYANGKVDRNKFPNMKIIQITTNVYIRKNIVVPFEYKAQKYYASMELDEKYAKNNTFNDFLEEKVKEAYSEISQASNDEYVIARQINKKILYEEGKMLHQEGIDIMKFIRMELMNRKWDKQWLHEIMSIKNLLNYLKIINK